VSLDALSDGRFVLGVGLGWSAEEYEACGVSFAERAERLDEYVEAIRTLWLDEVAAYDGRFVSFSGARLNPKPRAGTVPVFFGGGGERMLRRIGSTGDGWAGYGQSPQQTAVAVRRIQEHAAENDRDPAEIEIVMAPPYVPADRETRASIEEKLGRYAEAGVDEIALNLPPPQDAQAVRRGIEGLAETWLTLASAIAGG
jgi:probable F420-dependent oxidoreductase